ncbi:MAG: hypothetical protein WBG48_15465 [Pricia sp.]
MSKVIAIVVCVMGSLIAPLQIYAQEEPVSEPGPELDVENSAAVFLEGYSDEFQENFFEALKQKGIENYDRAINALLKCKQLDASNAVIDHELAKAYGASRQYPIAEDYALTAVTAEPENFWYTDTLIEILQKQGKSIEGLPTELPFDQPEFSENLASLYLKKGNYETALAIIKKATQNSVTKAMAAKINDSIQKRNISTTASSGTEAGITGNSDRAEKQDTEANPLDDYKVKMESLMQTDSLSELQKLSEEALENYPAQPYFYFVQGYALNKMGKNEQGIENLEAALDFLIDDTSLENKIYQELADAYTALDNAVKANMYLRKIKPGF